MDREDLPVSVSNNRNASEFCGSGKSLVGSPSDECMGDPNRGGIGFETPS